MDRKRQPRKLERLFHQAVGFHQSGNLAEAAQLYGKIIAVEPSSVMPRHLLGIVRHQQGRHTEALALIAGALKINPNFPEALSNYGLVLKALGRLDEALVSLDKALAIKPDYVGALNNRGNVLLELNRFDEALLSYDKVLATDPSSSQAWNNRGNALHHLKRLKDALASYEKALTIAPDYAEALRNRGKLLYEQGRREEALSSYHQALKSKADPVAVLYSCGFILQELKRFEEALANYDRALAIKPDYAEALNNRGVTLSELKRFEDAIPSFDKALSIKPDYTGAWNNRGLAFFELKRPEQALANYDQALAINRDYAEALNNRGNALRALNRFEDAIASYERALTVDPDYLHALSGLANSALSVCDWQRTAALRGDLITWIAGGKPEIQPFLMVGYGGGREIQLQCARNYIQGRIAKGRPSLCDRTGYGHDKIRIAYISSDFGEHPVGAQIVQLIELHDRSRFEVFGVSTGMDDGSKIRSRIESAFDVFLDLRTQGDRAAAELLRRKEVDIVIDLNGYTQGARPEIMSYRPAPVQVNYLGYAGTMGADFIDYVIADPIAVPFDQQECFTEKIVHLPDSFFVNDTKRTLTADVSRRDFGLPEQGFVYCAFNQHLKITAPVFDIWMRLLGSVPGSVLWLRQCNEVTRNNLRHWAETRGIGAERLVYADRVELDEHLARHRLADLFVDTFPYNAHTTASDALWAGLPLVTCKGESFGSRVAASLLHAVGVPELVANSLEDYEALALKLARDRPLLDSVRRKLAHNIHSHPLFNTDLFRRNIEAAYTRMWEMSERGECPRSFRIGEDG